MSHDPFISKDKPVNEYFEAFKFGTIWFALQLLLMYWHGDFKYREFETQGYIVFAILWFIDCSIVYKKPHRRADDSDLAAG